MEVTQLENNPVHDRTIEFKGQFVYHQPWLRAIALQFKVDVCLSPIDDTTAVTWDASDDGSHPSLRCVFVSVTLVFGDKEWSWNFYELPSGLSPGREHSRLVLNNI